MTETSTPARPRVVPPLLRWAFTAFMVVLVPTYWLNYGPTNFLYFCDASLFLALVSVWRNDPLPASMAAVGLLVPQTVWVFDLVGTLVGVPLTQMTDYMVDPSLPLFLRLLSLFHGWLPFLLVYLVHRLGYDKRALPAWTAVAWGLCLVAYFFLPPAGADVSSATPHDVNFVFGPDSEHAQTWIASPALYLVLYMLALFVVFFIPTHFLLAKLFTPKTTA